MRDLPVFLVLALVLVAVAVAAWRWVPKRLAFPCPPQFIWLLENRAMERVAGGELLIARAGVAPGMEVLDAGCGPGRLTLPLAARVGAHGRVTAFDIQGEMLSRLQARLEAKRVTNIRTLQGALGGGSLPPNTFDRALLVTVLGEIPDRARALRELHDSLKPGGILSVTEVLPDPHFQSPRTVRRLAGEAGFTVRESFGNWRAFTLNLVRAAAVPASAQ
jgi:ubiquinone/menaquinone biosynthesis C-methylase UbiE